MTTSSAVIQGNYFHLGPTLFYIIIIITSWIQSILLQKSLTNMTYPILEPRGARWDTPSGDACVDHELILGFALSGEWCDARTSLVLPSTARVRSLVAQMIAGSHGVSQTQKHDLMCPVNASKALCCCRPGWVCAGLRWSALGWLQLAAR